MWRGCPLWTRDYFVGPTPTTQTFKILGVIQIDTGYLEIATE